MDPDNERPDDGSTLEQTKRFDEARVEFSSQQKRIESSINGFQYSREQFHLIEAEFLSLIEELRRTDVQQIHNLAHLEGLRIRLLTSFESDYLHAVNALADSMLETIGIPNPSEPG